VSHWQTKSGFVISEKKEEFIPEETDIEFDFGHQQQSTSTDTDEGTTAEPSLPPPSPIARQEPDNNPRATATDTANRYHQCVDASHTYIRETRSGRVPKQRQLMSLCVPWDVFHDQSVSLTDEMADPIAFAASTNPDILCLRDAMDAPDCAKFEKAMADEVQSHVDNKHWELILKTQVPEGTSILPAVWAFRRKRRISTQEVHKWKARLNVHGGRQEHGVNCWETCSPAVGWSTIRLLLNMMMLNKWASRQVDFVLAFPQADIECDIYMEIPQGFNVAGDRKTHCLKLTKNLHGQKQAGRVWNHCMHDGLIARGFKQSDIDMCVCYRKEVMLMCHVDDGVFMAPTQAHIDECCDLLTKEHIDPVSKQQHRAFRMTDEGDLSDYLGAKTERLPNGTIKLTQPHLISQIIDDLGFNERTKQLPIPASSTSKTSRDLHGETIDEKWQCRSIIGKLNFLEKSSRPDIAYAVHQCARFSNDPKKSHAAAVKKIVKHLLGTRDKGIILNPQKHSFDCWVDADFVGNWDRVNADVDPSAARSRTAFIIVHGGCPVVWASKIQREVALSSTEAECNALSESLRSVTHLMDLMKETKRQLKWSVASDVPRIHCTVMEDNSGALEMARLPKMRPRTKHLCVKLHHFCDRVRNGSISIHKVPTRWQLADIATKGQPVALFESQRESILQQDAETMTDVELRLPAKHLRACETIEALQAGTLITKGG